MSKWMVSVVNSLTSATSKNWHVWEIELRFALISTPGWQRVRPSVGHNLRQNCFGEERGQLERFYGLLPESHVQIQPGPKPGLDFLLRVKFARQRNMVEHNKAYENMETKAGVGKT